MNEPKPLLTVPAIVLLGDLATVTALVFIAISVTGSQDRTATKPYPLNTCLVTDEAFEHGKPYTFIHAGQQIKLCCKDCLPKFKNDPAKRLAKLGPNR